MRRARLVLVLGGALTAATCYRPAAEQPCSISCEHDTDCPNAMSCNANGRCISAGETCTPGDANADVMVDVPSGSSGSACYGTGMVRVCFEEPPSGTVMVLGSIDTTSGSGCSLIAPASGAQIVCAIAAGDIAVNAATHAAGTYPLVLVASNSITLNAPLSVGSLRGGPTGAGAATDCDGAVGVSVAIYGAGGGAGGSFGTVGGTGGSGGLGPGGTAAAAPTMAFRGGCAGGSGGQTSTSNPAGAGGAGGGAVYLIAASSIKVQSSSVLDASGAGGSPGPGGGGGGGGGAGGFIGIDAPSLVLAGQISAGGGGGAGGGTPTVDAQAGNDVNTCSPALGGGGANDGVGYQGGDGGDGSVSGATTGSKGHDYTPGGSGPFSKASGGGGGGGAGVIMIYSTTPHASTSCPDSPI